MNERIVLDHVTMVASDLAASQRFYDAALAPLGISRAFDFTDATGYGGSDGKPDFWIIAGDPVSTGVHIAFYQAAVAAGGTSRHAPQEWPIYHPGYYGAFVNDPDGNNIEAVYHG